MHNVRLKRGSYSFGCVWLAAVRISVGTRNDGGSTDTI
jgi:hypothetical protein